MVAVLARLQLTLMSRALRQSPGRTAAFVIGGLFALVGALGLTTAFALLGGESIATLDTFAVSVLSTVVVAWIVLPLLLFGSDATLDPGRFALLPLSARDLRPGLVVAGLIGIPGVLTAVLALAPILGWMRHGLAAGAAAVVLAPVFLLTCFLTARSLTSWFASALASRRFQDFAAIMLGVFVLCAGLVSNIITNRAEENPGGAGDLAAASADVLAWTPLGWAAAVPGDVAEQDWGPAALRTLLSVALVVGLWALWGTALGRALTSVTDGEGARTEERSTFADRLYGATPTGAVAARCLRYWRRDPRYAVSLVSMAVVPIMIGVSTSLGSGGSTGLFAMPLFLVMMTGPALVTDLAYDNSALWTHVAVGVPGRADRIGRVLALATVSTPMILLSYLAALLLNARWDLALGVLAATVTILLCGFALGAVVGSRFPGQAPPPGTNPFGSGGSGGGMLTMVVFIGAAIAAVVAALPILVPLLVWGSSVVVQAVALLAGVAWGLVLLRLAVAHGGRQLEENWPDLLTQVSAAKG